MPKDTQALSLTTIAKSASVSLLPEMSGLVARKMEEIRMGDRKAVLLALQIGVLLWRVKATVKHGEFKAWIAENIEGRGYRACARYMKLAMKLAENDRISAAAFDALLVIDRIESGLTGTEGEIAQAVDKFSRDLSLTELMIKHGIAGVGLKSELTGEEPPALTAEQQQQQELALIWEQTYTPAKTLADVLTEKVTVLTADQRSALESELTRALDVLRRA